MLTLYRTVLAIECVASFTRQPRWKFMMLCCHVQNLIIQSFYILFFCFCHDMFIEWVDSPVYINDDSYLYTCTFPWRNPVNPYCIFLFGPWLNVHNLCRVYFGDRVRYPHNITVLLLITSQWYIIMLLCLPNLLSDIVVTGSHGVHPVPPDLNCEVA